MMDDGNIAIQEQNVDDYDEFQNVDLRFIDFQHLGHVKFGSRDNNL